jgi:hypothetical protein
MPFEDHFTNARRSASAREWPPSNSR